MKTDWSVYIVKCSDGTLYTGVAKNVASRLIAHNAGRGAKYTKCRRPVHLIHEESGFSHGDALRREYAIKQLPRREKFALTH